jgi:hypothetical protein
MIFIQEMDCGDGGRGRNGGSDMTSNLLLNAMLFLAVIVAIASFGLHAAVSFGWL